jgi:hypothetical protein
MDQDIGDARADQGQGHAADRERGRGLREGKRRLAEAKRALRQVVVRAGLAPKRYQVAAVDSLMRAVPHCASHSCRAVLLSSTVEKLIPPAFFRHGDSRRPDRLKLSELLQTLQIDEFHAPLAHCNHAFVSQFSQRAIEMRNA